MTESEKQDFIESIFSSRTLFEQHVLHVYNNSDRKEIMEILADKIINDTLREELNFLYLKDFTNFKFSLIRNILYKELASEWVSYADEKYLMSIDDATDYIQIKENALFILSLVKDYYEKYKECFFEQIADSFILLVSNMPNGLDSNKVIDAILKSSFVLDKNVTVMHNYNQLWSRVRNAHNRKKSFLTDIQVKIAEEEDSERVKDLQLREEEIEASPLAMFDDAVMRLRNTMIAHMHQMKS